MEGLRGRPGPTPFTVKHGGGGGMLEDADAADDGEDEEDEAAEWRRDLGGGGHGRSVVEPGGTVLAGNVSFPAP